MDSDTRSIIAAVDGSEVAGDALALARLLAAPLGAEVAAVYVHPYGDTKSVLDDEKYRTAMDEIADSLHGQMRELGVPVEERTLRLVADRSPARGLQRTAERENASLICVGSSHRSRVGRVFPGGTAERLLAGSPCPVAVAPRGFASKDGAVGVIGCGFDGGEEALAALGWVKALAATAGSSVRLLAVHEPLVGASVAAVRGAPLFSVNSLVLNQLGERVAGAENDLRNEGIEVESRLLEGDPVTVLEGESHDLDLLVTGSRSYGPTRAVLLGSVSTAVLRSAECPVVVIPRTQPG